MPVHHGRHELPGWRGYLPESVDRAARRGSDRRSLPSPPSRRVVAVGALAACAVAGGVVIHTRSAAPPDASPGPADDADSVLARSSAWIHEATPLLAALETELRRTDEVRRRWDASPLARRDRPPPAAVLALLERRSELAHHRDALRAAMTAVRSAPASESALVSAWPQLRAAEEMLNALVSRRGVLGDPVEAMVLRIVLEEDTSSTLGDGPASGSDARRSTPDGVEDTVSVALAATSELAPVASPTRSASDAVVRPVQSDSAESDDAIESSRSDTPELAAATGPARFDADGDDQQRVVEDLRSTGESPSSGPVSTPASDPVSATTSDPSMLTFDRLSPGAAEPESVSVGEVGTSSASDVTSDAVTGEETSAAQDRHAGDPTGGGRLRHR
jgi:hypothetical protein